jgi:hypothetical protein
MVTLNLELDGEEMVYKIPNGWDEVNVEQFADIFKLDREALTGIELSVEIVNILTGISEDDLYAMSPENFTELAKIIEFTNEDVVGNKCESIKIGEDDYFMKNDFEKLTMGEIISLELLIEQSNNNVISMFPELLCIFLRQKKENGKIESFKKGFMERAESFKSVSIADVNDLFLFFLGGVNLSEVNTKDSLEK